MRNILYIIGMLLGLLGLRYSVAHDFYATSVILVLLMVGIIVSMYQHQHTIRYQQQLIVSENAMLHSRLADGERHLRFMLHLTEEVETALCVVTPTGHIEWCNAAARRVVGEEAVTLPKDIAEAVANGADEVNGMALAATQLKIEGRQRTLVTLKDVHRLMEQHEMEAWKQLTRVLAHEILNSITPIIAIIDSLQTQLPEGETATGLAVVERRCRSLLAFVESYRKLARVEKPKKTTFDAREFLADLSQLFPQCEYEVEPEGLTLTADRAQMEQVMVNLLSNATEAEATHITLRAQPQRLTVTDNGQGMSPEAMQRIFTPFFTTKAQGSGIGLSLCKQIVTQHGGQIRVESKPDEGTTFDITL